MKKEKKKDGLLDELSAVSYLFINCLLSISPIVFLVLIIFGSGNMGIIRILIEVLKEYDPHLYPITFLFLYLSIAYFLIVFARDLPFAFEIDERTVRLYERFKRRLLNIFQRGGEGNGKKE